MSPSRITLLMADSLSPLTYGVIDFRLFHPQSARKRRKSNLQNNLNTKFLQLRVMPSNELEATFPRTERLTQANLHGIAISASDSEHFGHNFPSTPGTNTTIVTFQNIGQQPNDATTSKSTHNDRAFRSSNAGVALFAKQVASPV